MSSSGTKRQIFNTILYFRRKQVLDTDRSGIAAENNLLRYAPFALKSTAGDK